MERPKIKNKEVNEYIDYLESRLVAFNANTSFVKTYMALKKQNDSLAETYRKAEISADSLEDKNDKIFDRFMKYLDKVGALTDTLERLEQKIAPEVIKKVDKYINKSGVSVEEMLNI